MKRFVFAVGILLLLASACWAGDYDKVIYSEAAQGGLPLYYWPLYETGGTTAAALIGAANGTYTGTVTTYYVLNQKSGFIAREPWGVWQGKGTDAYVNVGTMGTFGSGMSSAGVSIECWFSTTNSSVIMGIFGMYDGTRILKLMLNEAGGSYGSGYWEVQWTDGASHTLSGYFSEGGTLYNGGRHHLVATLHPGDNTITFYFDGASCSPIYGTQTTPSSFANFGKAAYVGAYNVNGTLYYPFIGYLGRVAVYNYVLPPARIIAHYKAGLNGSQDIAELVR